VDFLLVGGTPSQSQGAIARAEIELGFRLSAGGNPAMARIIDNGIYDLKNIAARAPCPPAQLPPNLDGSS
jgi:hypothetical protein